MSKYVVVMIAESPVTAVEARGTGKYEVVEGQYDFIDFVVRNDAGHEVLRIAREHVLYITVTHGQ